jgi:hypothetical protein
LCVETGPHHRQQGRELSSEPYPFKPEQAGEVQAYLPKARVIFADGEAFSWYGSRLRHAPAYFSGLLAE